MTLTVRQKKAAKVAILHMKSGRLDIHDKTGAKVATLSRNGIEGYSYSAYLSFFGSPKIQLGDVQIYYRNSTYSRRKI